jgi:hypothetical protein
MWASTQEYHLSKASRDETPLPTIEVVIEDYRQHLRLQQSSSTKPEYSANATFKGNNQDGSAAQSTDKPADSRAPRKYDQCVCGNKKHTMRKCPELNAEGRPSGWKSNKEAVAEINRIAALKPGVTRSLERFCKPEWERIQKLAPKSDATTHAATISSAAQSKDLGSYFTTYAALTSTDKTDYKLYNMWTMDGGTDTHVCNNANNFTKTKDADGSVVYAGKTCYSIEAFGICKIDVQDGGEKAQMTLLNVALIPGFMTSLVSLQVLNDKGVHWNSRNPTRLEKKDGSTFCELTQIGKHWVFNAHCQPQEHSSFAGARDQLKVVKVQKTDLHSMLGHPGPEVLDHSEAGGAGIEVIDRNAPAQATVDCEYCALSKATQKISRSSLKEHIRNGLPFDEIAWDLVYMSQGYNGHLFASHIRCLNTGFDLVETHPRLRDSLKHFLIMTNFIEKHLGFKIRFVTLDGERNLQGEFVSICGQRGYKIQRSAPKTQAQNGAAEVAGKQIVIRARTIRLEANLPANLWPEILKASVYLGNRTVVKGLGWKSPFELIMGMKPSYAHLKPYGCRAYPLDKDIPKLDKLQPRAHIGHLVGYESTNIFRIWIPSLEKVIRTRDVSFDPKRKFKPHDIDAGLLVGSRINTIINKIDLPERAQLPDMDTIVVESQRETAATVANAQEHGNTQNSELMQSSEASANEIEDSDLTELLSTNQKGEKSADAHTKPTEPFNDQLRTPEQTPHPDSTSDYSSPLSEPQEFQDADEELTPFNLDESDNTAPRAQEISSDFNTSNIIEGSRTRSSRGAHFASSAFSTFLSSREKKIHRSELPPEPTNWAEAKRHKFRSEWMKAAQFEVDTLMQKGTFKYVSANMPELALVEVLPLKWVPKYKFDEDGYLTKFKMRVVARGDLQHTDEDTYAATLAAQTFRAVMAIVAAFDLETRQYDAVNAFVNAKLKNPVYCKAPPGFEKLNHILMLMMALYGLKISPNLWYNHLIQILEDLGLSQVPGVNCLFTNDWLILLFYVDDIVLIHHSKHTERVMEFEAQLMSKFELRYLGEINHFLGVRVIRQRDQRKIYLIQDSYITKLGERFNVQSNARSSLLPTVELTKFEGKATASQIKGYQEKVGSLTYAAVISRPDIAKSISKLAGFQQNPSPLHIKAADHCLQYLLHTRNLAIEYDGNDFADSTRKIFIAASDAAYSDDPETRYSSNGFCFKLYGGMIHWKATKQQTVTTSSTEAELLALSSTSKEFMWWIRLFRNIEFDLEEDSTIYCDNTQTIRLLQMETPRLITKLKHVDVHSCWIRQEVQKGSIYVQWISTNDMVADGLTKALSPQKHARFIELLGLKDISSLIEALQ